MTLADLNAFIALLISIALAGDRGVAMLKNVLPELFALEPLTASGEPDLPADRIRRTLVQASAFLFCWIAAGVVCGGMIDGSVILGSAKVPAVLVGFLASGGAAFWGAVLGFTTALRDLRRQQAALTTLEQQGRAEGLADRPSAVAPPVGGRLTSVWARGRAVHRA